MQAQARPAWSWLLLAPLPILLVASVVYGVGDHIDIDYRWMLAAFALLQSLLAAVALQAAKRGSHWTWVFPLVAAMPAIVGVVVFAGPLAFLSGVLLALAALGIGSRIAAGDSSPAIMLLVGGAVIAALVGWLLPFQIHRRWLYLLMAALVVAWRARALIALLGDAATSLRDGAARHPAWSILAIAAATVASLGLWLPSLNYDDNAVHLILQSQLLADGYYRLDVQSQSWAVAPWANNVLHAVAAMLVGQEARAAVGALWLLIGIDGARRLASALGAPPRVALAAAAIFAAQPFAGYFTTTLQVDGASAAILLQLAAIAATPAARRPGPLAIGAIGGLLMALKTVNLLFASPLLVWLAWSSVPGLRLGWTLRMLAILLPLAASNYCYAFLVTGNPLFPFFNAVFQSPFYPPENLRDTKWMAGVTWLAPWDLAFHAERYGQYYAGASGLAMLATMPALLVDAARRSAPRWLALWALACAALLFLQMQYLRYLFPAYAVLAVLGVVALARVLDWRGFVAAMLLLVPVDAALMPTTSWIVRANPWAALLRDGPAARAVLVREIMPERVLLERIVAGDPGACVLMTHPKRPFVGTGRGHALSMHRRYDPELWRARNVAESDVTGATWVRLLDDIGASHVVLASDATIDLMRALAASGYVAYASEGTIRIFESPNDARCIAASGSPRDQSARIRNVLSRRLIGPGTTSVE